MIGNRGYAMYIREWVRDTQRAEGLGNWSTPRWAPDGWQYLGQGCYRGAYLSPDKVVYKIQVHPGRFSGQPNFDEYRRWWKLRLRFREMDGMRWPLMNCFEFEGGDDINAMDHVGKTLSQYDGPDRQHYVTAAQTFSWHVSLSDMHHGNLAVDEERKLIVPIDLGM